MHPYQNTINNVVEILNNEDLTSFVTMLVDRLLSLGYAPSPHDDFAIAFNIERATNHILNSTNQPSVPEGLKDIHIDMTCGLFLTNLYQTGQLNIETLDLVSGAVTQVAEGDTSVSFDGSSTDVGRFNNLMNRLIYGRESELVCYRQMKW